MTSLRSARRPGTALVAGLLAAAAIVMTGGPAVADPSPAPSTPGSPGAAGPLKPPPGSITWAVQPSSADGPDRRSTFAYNNIKAGTVIHDYVGVTNFSDIPVTFDVYASDAFNTASGSLDLLPAAEKPRDVGSWVSFPKTTLTIAPGSRVNEPFTVTIPANAMPGDHTGGILASISVATTNGAGTTVKVDRRIAVPMYLRVAGALHPAVAIESVSGGYHGTANPFGGGGVDVTYTVHNTGNVRVDLSQDVAVTGLFGITLGSSHPKALSDLLPGATYHVTQHLPDIFPLGPMSVRVHGVPTEVAGIPPAPAKPEAVSFDVDMWGTPWLLLLVVVLLAGGFFGGRWLLRLRRRARAEVLSAAMAKARRDTVEQLRRKATEAKAKLGASTGGGEADPKASE